MVSPEQDRRIFRGSDSPADPVSLWDHRHRLLFDTDANLALRVADQCHNRLVGNTDVRNSDTFRNVAVVESASGSGHPDDCLLGTCGYA